VDLELTDEQGWLAESVAGTLAKSGAGSAWSALVEFGALEIAGGDDGLGAVELALISKALGASLTAVPFIDTAAARYATGGEAISEHPVVAGLRAGDDAVALCLLEPGSGWDLERLATVARGRDRGGVVIDGHKLAVQHAAAGRLLVLHRDGDERRLALVQRDAAGITLTPTASIDESVEGGAVTLAGVALGADDSLPADGAELVLLRLLGIGGVLAAAEAVGAAETLVRSACEYAGQRRQFGRTIGSFQALRHMLADMYVKQVSSWSTVLFAAAALDEGTEDALLTASIAKAYASRATVEIAHAALQVFGGIAFTAEHPAHTFLRRILVRAGQFGDARHHERAIGKALAGGSVRLPEAVA
jgi:alkylation response protein AidB-like acyl-CoA dehydrogenase